MCPEGLEPSTFGLRDLPLPSVPVCGAVPLGSNRGLASRRARWGAWLCAGVAVNWLSKSRRRRLKIRDALQVLKDEEGGKLVNAEALQLAALRRALAAPRRRGARPPAQRPRPLRAGARRGARRRPPPAWLLSAGPRATPGPALRSAGQALRLFLRIPSFSRISPRNSPSPGVYQPP